ncbi:MAG: hypothetical protein RLZZ306_1764 [Bacteroidota bacterium]|jgi:hypothetical protein
MILLQAGIAYGFLLLIMLIILVVLALFVVFIRSDNHFINLIEKGETPTLKYKIRIVFKNLLYYLAFALPLIGIIYWSLKDVIIM